MTYQYYRTQAAVGELYNIENVYIRNEIKTIVGPTTETFLKAYYEDVDIEVQEEPLKFFVLNFKQKEVRDIVEDDGHYYDESTGSRIEINNFDTLCLYRINSNYYYVNNNNLLPINTLLDDWITIKLKDTDNKTIEFKDPPILNLHENFYSSITLGAAYYLECAYQVKITKYRVG